MERGVGLFQQLILSTQVQNWGYLWMFQQLCNMQNQSHSKTLRLCNSWFAVVLSLLKFAVVLSILWS